jgi:histidine kinase/DNA gyrase B/HSP90-like ATPase
MNLGDTGFAGRITGWNRQSSTCSGGFTAARYAGTGIGLTICKKIIERQGGGIWVEENPEGGCIFRFAVADPRVAMDNGSAPPKPPSSTIFHSWPPAKSRSS